MQRFVRAAFFACLVATAAGCTRDLTVPPLPGAGGVNGHVVSAVPGRSDRRPAAGAVVSLVGSGLETTTNAGGTFALDLEAKDGLLLFRFDADKDGTVDQQLVLRLSDYGTGPHKRVDLGEVLLGQNAAVSGRVLLGNVATKSGHGGTAVFVPEGPFAATTADDGTFAIQNLPSGPLTFMVFRAGYTPVSLGDVTLRAGEDFTFRDVVLTVNTEPQLPGRLKGALTFTPPATGKGDSAVSALAAGQQPIAGAVADDLSFAFASLPPGLYAVTATRSGYTPARASNVLVLPAAEATVATIALGTMAAADAGQPPAVDAGMDAGIPGLCAVNAQCLSTEYCDDGRCARQCAVTADCSNGRACDPVTRACVRSCNGGCPSGLTCDVPLNLCRVACDSSFPCGPGFKCDASNRCVPECAVAADCAIWQACHAGQCEENTVCTTDLHCAPTKLCLTGSCVPRPTKASDAGLFPCTQPCHCREGEWCEGGECVADPVKPTFFFKADAGGDGKSSVTPSGDLVGKLASGGTDQAYALRAGDQFTSSEPFRVMSSRVGLAGGYVDCAPGRWVRDGFARTTLRVLDGGTAVKVGEAGGAQLDDVTVANLQLDPDTSCDPGQLSVDVTRRFLAANIRGRFKPSQCTGASVALVRCENCVEANLQSVALQASADPLAAQGWVVRMIGGYGRVEGTTVEPQPQAMGNFTVVGLESPAGPCEVRDTAMSSLSGPVIVGIGVSYASAALVNIENNFFAWPTATAGGSGYRGVALLGCPKVRVANNLFDGTGVFGPLHSSSIAVQAVSAGGTVELNTVKFPSATNAVTVMGVDAYSIVGQFDVRDNRMEGGSSGTLVGIQLVSTAGGPVKLARNSVELGPAASSYGLYLNATIPTGLVVEDNLFSAQGLSSCVYSEAFAGYLYYATVRAERNRFFADKGGQAWALRVYGDTKAELYSNHFWAGTSSCAAYSSTAIDIYGNAEVTLKGNTLDPRGTPTQPGSTRGLVCTGVGRLISEGNIIGSGRATDHLAVSDAPTGGCVVPADWQANYFWYEQLAAAAPPNEGALAIVTADAGLKDGNGNLFGLGTSCFAAPAPLPDGGEPRPYLLAASTPCIDTGKVLLRKDLTTVELDLDGKSRLDAGAGPDLGCSERR